MSDEKMMDAESVARQFHEAYERLAPSFGYETRKASALPWEQIPENNRRLMIAVASEVCRFMLNQNGRLFEALLYANQRNAEAHRPSLAPHHRQEGE